MLSKKSFCVAVGAAIPQLCGGKHHKAMNSPVSSATGLMAYRRGIVACFVFRREISRKAVWDSFDSIGPSRTLCDVRFCAAVWGQADIGLMLVAISCETTHISCVGEGIFAQRFGGSLSSFGEAIL
jgi:hypothetical protein